MRRFPGEFFCMLGYMPFEGSIAPDESFCPDQDLNPRDDGLSMINVACSKQIVIRWFIEQIAE